MAESGCLRDLAVQNLDVAGSLHLTDSTLCFKRKVITPGGAARTLLVEESGSLVIVAASDAIVLPKITANDIGTTYTFLYPTASNDPATIKTSGLAALGDDFVPGGVPTVCTGAQTSASFISSAPIADNDNTFTFDGNLTNGLSLGGSSLTCTAVAASANGANVWYCTGQLITSAGDNTGTAYFT